MAQPGSSGIEVGSEAEEQRSSPPNAMGKKFAHCSVKLLDGKVMRFNIERKQKAQVIIDRVLNHVNIQDKDFFGVYFAHRNQRVFLNPFKSTSQQVEDSKAARQWVLHLGVKYYAPNPHYVKDDNTKQLLCLQILQDIKEGRIDVQPESGLARELVALTLQEKLGDFTDPDHSPGYAKPYFNFLYKNENDIPSAEEEAVAEHHKELRGKSPGECDDEILRLCKDLDRYGKQLFTAEEFMEDRLVEVGANYNGVTVYFNKKIATNYPWSRVNKLLFHGRKFKVRYHPDEDLEEVRSHKFVAADTKWARLIWQECVEQHTFFRLAIPGSPPLPRVVPQLNRDSKYRFSGRTLHQMTKPPPRSPSPVSSPPPVLDDAPQDDPWVVARPPSPTHCEHAGFYSQSVSVDVAAATGPAPSSHGVAMICFPYDYSPTPYLKYRIVIRDGHKVFQKELVDPPQPQPTPSYRLKWAYVRNADVHHASKPEAGVAIIEPRQAERRPVNVISPNQGSEYQVSPAPTPQLRDRGDFTSTESLEDIIDKEMRKKAVEVEV